MGGAKSAAAPPPPSVAAAGAGGSGGGGGAPAPAPTPGIGAADDWSNVPRKGADGPRAATTSPGKGRKLSPLPRRRCRTAEPDSDSDETDRSPRAPRHDDHRITRKPDGRLAIHGASARLVKLPPRPELSPVDRGEPLTSEAEAQLNDRLYIGPLRYILSRDDRDEEELARMRSQKCPPSKTKVISHDEMDALLDRLHAQSHSMQKKLMATVRNKLPKPAPKKKFNFEEQTSSTMRMYNEYKDRQKEKHNNLIQKYIHETQPSSKKLSKQQMADSAARLVARGAGT